MLESILETAATSVGLFLFSLWGKNKEHKKLRERGLYYSWKGFATFWAIYVIFFLWFFTPEFHDTLGNATIGVGIGATALFIWAAPFMLGCLLVYWAIKVFAPSKGS